MSESFRDRIQIKQNDDILRLQEKYENGIIKEKDIGEEDKKKLIELYQKQNEELEKELNRYKVDIRSMLDSME